MFKYIKKISLTAEEISSINNSLRENLAQTKKLLKNAPKEDYIAIKEHYDFIKKLQQKIQRLSLKMEKKF